MGDLLLFSQERTQFICNGMNLLVDVLHPDILTHAPERSGRIESPLNSIYAARPRIPVCRVHSLFSICKRQCAYNFNASATEGIGKRAWDFPSGPGRLLWQQTWCHSDFQVLSVDAALSDISELTGQSRRISLAWVSSLIAEAVVVLF